MLSKIALIFSICSLAGTIWLHTDTQAKIDLQKLKMSHFNSYANLFWPLKGIRFPVLSNENNSGSQKFYGLKGRYCESSQLGGAVFQFNNNTEKGGFHYGDIVREEGKNLSFDLEAQGDYLIKDHSVILTGHSYKKIRNFTYSILTIEDGSGESGITVTGFGDKYHWYTQEACRKYKDDEFTKLKISN